ncbi:hypothetical protein JD969_02330 [Planctomycetota bacterium]|nr:hypothetical protein JD969_02330 [Planctomycetota bacterium]
MLKRVFSECMLRPSDLRPAHEGMRVVGAFNPGVVQHEESGDTYIVARVVEELLDKRDDAFASPRFVYEGGDGMAVDWLDKKDVDLSDPRLYQMNSSGLIRLRFISHLRVFLSKDGKTIDKQVATICPESEYEVYGLEDPRITRIGDTYYMTYVAVSPHGAATGLMSTKDFKSFSRHGIILPPDNKDVILFPEKVNGQFAAMHRPMPSLGFSRPEIWMAYSNDLIHWGQHEQLLGAAKSVHRDRIGGGTPPVLTKMGYMTFYHGSDKAHGEEGVGKYTAGVLVLDEDDPTKIIMQTMEPIMLPKKEYETKGFVDNVVFPTAVVERDDLFYVYYGAADENTAVTAFEKRDVFDALKPV